MILQVGVKIFLRNQDGKYLLMRRSLEKYPGVKGEWDIPGGRINPGSLLIENLRREVTEETQLEIISEPKLIYAQDIIPSGEKHVVRLSYVGETRGKPILDTSENVEYKWLSLNELKSYENVDIYAKSIIDGDLLDMK
jgi:ADP-ribose pyrophosphatase YjhB (NUDIX family)